MPKVTSADGTIITYDCKGRGPVLILVLGALNRRSQGKKLTELLSDRFTVVSYDRRGRGDSTDTLPYSPDKEVEDIAALIDTSGGKAYLYGHSSGCILALLAAQKLGSRVEGLMLYELPYNDDPEALKIAKQYREDLRGLLDVDEYDAAIALFVRSVGVSDKQIAAMERLPMWKGLTAMAPTLAYDTIELIGLYPQFDVSDLSTKALIMYGGKSPEFMRVTAEKLAAIMPLAEVRSIDGQVHDVKADVLAPELFEFMA